MIIRKATAADLAAVTELGVQLWPSNETEELAEEFSRIMAQEDAAFFLASDGKQTVGFSQCQLRRDYVEGPDSSPVGYLEGIFVADEFRRQGLAAQLLSACEDWAREKGCTEFASDCELDNAKSLRFHLSLGFSEANRIICFTKKL